MGETWVAITLLLFYHLVSALSWRLERRELLDKLMSRNYQDYQLAKNIDQTLKNENTQTFAQSLKDEEDMKENLAPIEAFGMN